MLQSNPTLPTVDGTVLARPVVPDAGDRRGIGIGEFRLADGGFWGRLQEVNRAETVQHCLSWMERLGWLANFDRVADGSTGGHRPGWQFSDSEIYKLLEALAWETARSGDGRSARLLETLTTRVAAAQDPDGYLNTRYGHAGQEPRYSDLETGHELYCVGHLLQAAVAVQRGLGGGALVDVARRAADEVCATFGEGARVGICGHPEIEVGLAEFGRAVGEPRYVAQAALFVERRGRGLLGPIPLLGPAYFQDDVPVREAQAWTGHAVRALYLAAAAVDVAVDTADDGLLKSIQRQWDRSVARRTYLTGGMGSRHQDEGFGEDFELPPDRAYCETCAGIASCMVSWRLYLATGDVRYADLMERTYYNVVATSPRSDGKAFFYANPLQQRVAGSDVSDDAENPRAEGGARAPWFDVSCCPTNLARTLATWHTYAFSVEPGSAGADVVTVLQYAAGDAAIALSDGATLRLRVTTAYPVEGEIRFEVLEAPRRGVDLRMRVPVWATSATLARGGPAEPAPVGWRTESAVRAGETLTLQLPLAPRWTWPDPRIDAVRGCVAVEQGPLVLCLESLDLPEGVSLDAVSVRTDVAPVVGDAGTTVLLRRSLEVAPEFPYGPTRPGSGRSEESPVVLRPYHQWAERGATEMRVFLPVVTSES